MISCDWLCHVVHDARADVNVGPFSWKMDFFLFALTSFQMLIDFVILKTMFFSETLSTISQRTKMHNCLASRRFYRHVMFILCKTCCISSYFFFYCSSKWLIDFEHILLLALNNFKEQQRLELKSWINSTKFSNNIQ